MVTRSSLRSMLAALVIVMAGCLQSNGWAADSAMYASVSEGIGLTLAPGQNPNGIPVRSAETGSDAAQKGIAAGDKLVEVNGQPVANEAAVVERINDAVRLGRAAVLLRIFSSGQYRLVPVRLMANTAAKSNEQTGGINAPAIERGGAETKGARASTGRFSRDTGRKLTEQQLGQLVDEYLEAEEITQNNVRISYLTYDAPDHRKESGLRWQKTFPSKYEKGLRRFRWNPTEEGMSEYSFTIELDEYICTDGPATDFQCIVILPFTARDIYGDPRTGTVTREENGHTISSKKEIRFAARFSGDKVYLTGVWDDRKNRICKPVRRTAKECD